jgi:RimJ/RimL family protein N-acetyltransferase
MSAPRFAVLQTDRLRLIPLGAADAAELFTIRGDAEAMAYWDAPPDEHPELTAEVVSQLLRDVTADAALYWCARRRADERFVGLFDLSEIVPTQSADLGFMTVRSLWGGGFAFEACEAVIAQARRLGLVTLRARIHVGNSRSARLLARLGFTALGPPVRRRIRPGIERDCMHFELRLVSAP